MITTTYVNGLWRAEGYMDPPTTEGYDYIYYFKGYGHTPQEATDSLLDIISRLSNVKRQPYHTTYYDLTVTFNAFTDAWTASTILDTAVMSYANGDTPEEATNALLASLPGDYHYHTFGVDTSSFLFND